MKISLKATLLFTVLSTAPLAGAILVFGPRYGEAVRAGEQRAALVAASEVNGVVNRHIDATLSDAQAVAASVARASDADDKEVEAALLAMEMMLATRTTIDLAVIEVPDKASRSVLAKKDADKSLAPTSTPALREKADEQGSSFALEDQKRGILVVPVPPSTRDPKRPRAYVTVPVYLQGLQLDLQTLAEGRGLDASMSSNVAILDGDRRVIASVGVRNLSPGDSGQDLPYFQAVKADPTVARVEFQGDLALGDGTDPMSITLLSVGRYDTGRTLGWSVAIEQPHKVVYARLHKTTRLLWFIGGAAVAFGLLFALLSARAVTTPVLKLVEQAKRIGRRAYREVAPLMGRTDEIGELDRAMIGMATDLEAQEKEIEIEAQRRADLSRFMSPELVNAIVAGEHSLELGGRRTEISVLFADVVAFTPLAEKHLPETSVAILNELFTLLTEVVFKHGGLVDKFLGDSVMAVWGAPVSQPDHAERALQAAEDMLRFIEPAAHGWKSKFGVEVRLAIGVNSGLAIVGNIGSRKRMEYTAIGDVVNVAARLEAMARPNQILVGPKTAALGGDSFSLRELGPMKLAGRAEEIRVFELEV